MSILLPVVSVAIAVAVNILVFGIFWKATNPDVDLYELPWYDFVKEHGFSAFGTAPPYLYPYYTPAYLYLLGISTFADGLFGPAMAIRGLSVAFNGVAAVLVFRFALACNQSRQRAFLTAFLFFMLPEMVVNSAIWGQWDIVYTVFLMAFSCSLLLLRGDHGGTC